MKLKKNTLLISILLHALFVITVYIFQGAVFPFVRIGGLVPLMLPVAATGIALYEGQYTGGIVGLFSGLLCDLSFNQPAGVFTVFLTLSGLIIGAISDAYILPGFITYYISCAVVLILSTAIQMFPLMVFEEYSIPFHLLLPTAIQQTIYSLIVALPIWFFVRALGKRAERASPSGQAL